VALPLLDKLAALVGLVVAQEGMVEPILQSGQLEMMLVSMVMVGLVGL
jgi:hypothetical protein